MKGYKLFVAIIVSALFVLPAAAIGLVDSMTLVCKGNAHYMGFIKV